MKIIYMFVGCILNPVRAGICSNPADYPYSSFRKHHLGITDTMLDNYEAFPDLKQSLRLDHTADIAKNVFSLSPAIGSNSFIKKFKCLSQR